MSIADKLTQIAENEQRVYEAGYEKGKVEGGDPTAAYEQGVADGKMAEYDSFWDAYQKMGGPQQYVYSFAGYGWDDTTFKPKYDIIMRYSCLGAFQYNEATDIAQALFDCGVTLDTSGASSLQGAFGYSKTKRLPVISAEGANSATGIFEGCTRLERIEKFVLVKKNVLTRAFEKCTKLKDIVFEGEIGNNTDLQYSPLSKDSITSVLGVLSDTTSGLTLTLNRVAVENAFVDTDGEQAEISISGKQSDGFYIVDFASGDDRNSLLEFAVPMDISFHGAFLADSDWYEVDILRNGVYRLNMREEVTATTQNGDKMDLSLYDLLSDGGPIKIKRTDGRDLSSGAVTAYLIGELNYEWFDLIATKPNWDIILI